MTETSSLHIAVVGGGPGGYAAAFLAADLGLKVTLIDPEANPGGVCLYRGCIPSKALLHVAKLIDESRHAKNWGIEYADPKIDLARLRSWKEGVVKKLTGGLGILSKQRKVEYIQGRAAFENSNTLRISKAAGGEESLTFDRIILATGSPAPLAPKLARHVRPMMMHHVVTPPLPAALRKAMGARGTVVRLAGVPARRLRWTDHRVLFSGGDHAPVPERARERAVVRRTGQLMYELSLVYPAISGVQPELGWDAALSETLDGLPFIGPHRALTTISPRLWRGGRG
jgi:glycine/D-amino acid oxidase-like deaminating enzyme